MSLPIPTVPYPEELDELYRVLGKALTRWQYIETALYLLVHCLMGAEHEQMAIAFFHTKSAENKLALADKLVFHSLSQNVYKDKWKPLRLSLSKIVEFRNALAHFEVFVVNPVKFKPPTKYHLAIAPHHLDVSARRSGNIRVLSVEAIDANAEVLRERTYRLIEFIVTCVPHIEQRIKSLPQDLQRYLGSFRKTTTTKARQLRR